MAYLSCVSKAWRRSRREGEGEKETSEHRKRCAWVRRIDRSEAKAALRHDATGVIPSACGARL